VVKQLEGYKYFEAAENHKKYVGTDSHIERAGKKINVFTRAYVPLDYGGAHFTVNKNSYYTQNEQTLPFVMYNTNYFDNSFRPKPEHITGILDERSAADYKSDPAFYKQYADSQAKKGIYIPEIIFFKAIEEMMTANNQIKHVVFEYIKRYVTGWFLLNIDLFIDYKSYVKVYIYDSFVSFEIYRSDKKYGISLNGIKTVCMPLIKKIIIDEVIDEVIYEM
jgi:hypothetical protein